MTGGRAMHRLHASRKYRVGKNNQRTGLHSIRERGIRALLEVYFRALSKRPVDCKHLAAGLQFLGPAPIHQPFLETEDQTGLFKPLLQTKSVAFAWVQVMVRKKAFVCIVYATSLT